MKIDKIEIQKNNREKVNIHADGKYAFSLTLNGLLDSGIHEGDELSEEEVERIKENDAPALATLKAIEILSYSMKTETELKRKLREKKFSENAIETAVCKMKNYGYISDETYVTSYITSKAIPNGWGEQKVISMLLGKGVELSLIKKKLEEIYPDDKKFNTALQAGEKYVQKLKDTDERKKKQKLYNHLASSGYKFDVIKEVSRKLFNEEDYYN